MSPSALHARHGTGRTLPAVLAGMVLVLCTAATSPVRGSDLRFESWLEPARCRVGERVRLTIEVGWDGEAGDHEIDVLDLPDLSAFAVEGQKTTDQSRSEDGITGFLRRFEIVFRPVRTGEFPVSPTRIRLTDTRGKATNLASQPFVLDVTGHPLDALGGPPVVGGAVLGSGLVVLLVLLARRASARARADRGPAPEPADARIDALFVYQDHRRFYDAALAVLREETSRLLAEELPRDREALARRLRERGVREPAVHVLEELWGEIDQGRFNPEPPTGKDRERIVFQIKDLLKEMRGGTPT